MRLAHRITTRIAEALPGRRPFAPPAPMASLTFDDFPRSAWHVGGPILERFGVKASYYPAGGFCGRFAEGNDQFTAADLREVRDAGHEIGCHSFSHRPAPSLSRAAFAADLDHSAAFLSAEAGVTPQTFAYPYGWYSPSSLTETAARFRAARGVRGGVNAGRLDPNRLAAFPLETRSWSPDRFAVAVEATVARRGWLVLFTHDVSDTPTPYGCTPDMLEHVLATLAQGGIGVTTVSAALDRNRQAISQSSC